ncbi:ABC transporter substrate-binding protein [Lederbergia citri]|uniref:Extracellular solute-binding protein n=1 Tax=Lederbergia citri TaxID=2833580 RepID=A0A942TDK4_9BACI|nr:extracellular solute-binding protein [Lederbergia citri]MBS4195700.1 extracellular solute-binding protein [Lederbergia citri]
MSVKNLRISLILILLFSIIISACSSEMSAPNSNNKAKDSNESKDGKTTLMLWDPFTDPSDSAVLETIIKSYEEKNPNIKIKRNTMKNDDIRKTIKPALTSNEGPDMFFYDAGPGYLGVLAKAGQALDLTTYSEHYGWDERFPEWVTEHVTFDDKIYGIGNEIELIGVYYNKKIFQKLGVDIPKTYDAFLEILEKAKSEGIVPISFDDKDQWPAFHLESVFYTAVAGKEKIDKVLNNEEGFDQPIFAEALDEFAKLVKNGYTSANPLSVSYDDGNKEFYSGKAAMRITGTWMVSGMVENMKDNVGFFLMPSINPSLPTSAPGGIGGALVVNANTKHPDETVDFLDYMFSEEMAKIWYENSVIPPIDIDVEELNINSLAKDVINMANSPAGLSYNIDVLMPQKVNNVTQNILQELIAGKKSGEEVVKAKQEAFEEEIAAGNY